MVIQYDEYMQDVELTFQNPIYWVHIFIAISSNGLLNVASLLDKALVRPYPTTTSSFGWKECIVPVMFQSLPKSNNEVSNVDGIMLSQVCIGYLPMRTLCGKARNLAFNGFLGTVFVNQYMKWPLTTAKQVVPWRLGKWWSLRWRWR